MPYLIIIYILKIILVCIIITVSEEILFLFLLSLKAYICSRRFFICSISILIVQESIHRIIDFLYHVYYAVVYYALYYAVYCTMMFLMRAGEVWFVRWCAECAVCVCRGGTSTSNTFRYSRYSNVHYRL